MNYAESEETSFRDTKKKRQECREDKSLYNKFQLNHKLSS